jgi:hypothetical protein
LIFSAKWIFDEEYKDKPFYIEDWNLIAALDTYPWDYIIWHTKMIRDFSWDVNQMNYLYNEVRNILNNSNWDLTKYVWIIVDFLLHPENIVKYKKELWNQPWYNSYLKK